MELNKTYILRVSIGGRLLTYNPATVTFEDSFFIQFIDKFNKKISVNKSQIMSFEEVELR